MSAREAEQFLHNLSTIEEATPIVATFDHFRDQTDLEMFGQSGLLSKVDLSHTLILPPKDRNLAMVLNTEIPAKCYQIDFVIDNLETQGSVSFLGWVAAGYLSQLGPKPSYRGSNKLIMTESNSNDDLPLQNWVRNAMNFFDNQLEEFINQFGFYPPGLENLYRFGVSRAETSGCSFRGGTRVLQH